MDRRAFLAALACSPGLAPRSVRAQSAARVFRIGYLQTATPDEQAPLTRAFEDGLREHGYVDGRNVVIERRFAWGAQERLPALADELVRLNVDVIVTGGNPVIAAVKRATTTIPVVMGTSRDPVASGFVASLARPGGNITGLSGDPSSDVQAKRLELLKAAVPGLTRVAVLWNPPTPGADAYRRTVEGAAAALGMRVHVVAALGRDQFAGAFAAMVRERAEGLVVLPEPVFFTARAQIVELAATHRLPAVYHAREVVDIGGLMSYGVSLTYQFHRAAWYVDRILKGAKPGDLAVEQATQLELAINARTAGTLGLVLAPSLLQRADVVIR